MVINALKEPYSRNMRYFCVKEFYGNKEKEWKDVKSFVMSNANEQ